MNAAGENSDMLLKLRRRFALHLVLPYIRNELPGWGKLYQFFVGGYSRNHDWSGEPARWVRGKLHGYEMLLDLSRWSSRQTFFLGRFYDLPTQLATQMVLRAGDTFVDVGANEGMISLLAAHVVGPTGKVIAFEPNPVPRAALRAAIERNGIVNLQLRPLGLGAVAAELVLNVPRINSGEGSFGTPDYEDADLDRIACPVSTGDEELRGERPRLIKVDVEGFEAQVFAGLEATLAGARPVLVTEVVSQHLANAGSSAGALTAILETHGYSAWRMALRRRGGRHELRLVPDRPAGQDYWADVMWVHRGDTEMLRRVEARC
jgi:FkbM family methyltransferase